MSPQNQSIPPFQPPQPTTPVQPVPPDTGAGADVVWDNTPQQDNPHAADPQPSGFVDTVKHYWRTANDFIETMPGPGGISKALQLSGDFEKAMISNEYNTGHPYRAALASIYFGGLSKAADIFTSMASPGQIALNTAAGGAGIESAVAIKAARMLALGSNAYFAFRGSQALMQGKMDGETTSEMLQRRFMAGAQIASSLAGIGSTAKDITHEAIQRSTGITGDLAKQVAEKVQEATAARNAVYGTPATPIELPKPVETAATTPATETAPTSAGPTVADPWGTAGLLGTDVPPVKVDTGALYDAMIKKGLDPGSAGPRADEITRILKNPDKYYKSEITVAQRTFDRMLGPEQRGLTRDAIAEEVTKQRKIVESLGGTFMGSNTNGVEFKLPRTLTDSFDVDPRFKDHVSATIPYGAPVTFDTVKAAMERKVTEFGGKLPSEKPSAAEMGTAGVAADAGKALVESTQQIAQGLDEQIGGKGKSGLNAAGKPAELPMRMGQLMADAANVIHVEKARVEKLFTDLHAQADTPVTDNADMRAEILNTIKGFGVQDGEIPQRIFNALPDPNAGVTRPLTNAENMGAQAAANMERQGISHEDIRSALVNMSFVPKQIDAIMAVAMPGSEVSQAVSFKNATRVKNDLYDAAMAAKDGTVRNALFAAHDNVVGMQERYAVSRNFDNSNYQKTVNGQPMTVNRSYENAKQQYTKFKNELGVGVMKDFMDAQDAEQFNSLNHISQLMDGSHAQQLQTIFRIAGVDVSPLDALIKERGAIASAADERVADIKRQTEMTLKSMGMDLENKTQAIGERNSIIKGESDLQLQGLSTEQIRRNALEHTFQNARAVGITNPYAYIQIAVGMARMMMGSMFGTLQVAAGTSRFGIQSAFKSESFKDWVAKESGVEGPALPGFKKMIPTKFYDAVRQLAKSSVLAHAINTANQLKQQPQQQQQQTQGVSLPPAPAPPVPEPATPATATRVGVGAPSGNRSRRPNLDAGRVRIAR